MNLHLVHIKTCFQGIELIKSRIKLILTLMVNIIFLVSLAECLSLKKKSICHQPITVFWKHCLLSQDFSPQFNML